MFEVVPKDERTAERPFWYRISRAWLDAQKVKKKERSALDDLFAIAEKNSNNKS